MHKMEYALIRARRRTLSVTVRDGRVIVRAPYGMADAAIRKFLCDKRPWIEAKLAEQTRAASRFAAVRSGERVLDAGEEKPVRFGAPKNREDGNGFSMKNTAAVRGYFERTRGPRLVERVFALSRAAGVAPSGVSLCDFKARWGSCDAAGHITLNWRLAMLPPELRDYVIVHELCHLLELNHSAAFWRAVGKFCPPYKARRRELRDYSFLTQLYRRQG